MRNASSSAPPGDQAPRVYPFDKKQKSKQFQNGIYDSSILCGDCDGKIIGPWDKYGQELLLRLLDADEKPAFYRIDTFDYKRLKLFFMSILYRAGISGDSFFAQVELHAYERELRQMILDQNPGDANDFSVILVKYEGSFSEIMPAPTRHEEKGINFYRFRIPGFVFLIKVDEKQLPDNMAPAILHPDHSLLIQVNNYQDSQEYKTILEMKDRLPD